MTECVGCVQAHDKNLTASGCSTVVKEKYCADAGKPPAPAPPPPGPPAPGPATGARPDDCPCITWQHETCNTQSNQVNIDDFLPAIYSAYVWHGPQVGCTPCSGNHGDFYCAWIFPCFADAPGVDIWGHRDFLNRGVMMGGLPCNALPANGTRGSMGECSQYWAGKGPQWERFG